MIISPTSDSIDLAKINAIHKHGEVGHYTYQTILFLFQLKSTEPPNHIGQWIVNHQQASWLYSFDISTISDEMFVMVSVKYY